MPTDPLIRYVPDPAIRWLQYGAKTMRKDAASSGKSLVKRTGLRGIGKDLSQAAETVVGLGKSAVADLLHLQASKVEYVLGSEYFEIVSSNGIKRVDYSTITAAKKIKDTYHFLMENGAVSISPVAHIVASGIRAPIGWQRNGLEVPFDLLADEIAAHAHLTIEES